ncbi:hypothetical protein PF005_g13146 [Phytophthora fragariae]|uniref:SET domain-containing protein n=1 Tax=Phytophthora fragariae TaxID=53985 RepID=A0A6A3TQM3_9STRA|nr:hypothetical protein PF007_g13572 [Phytophthora fragariae]KAE9141562.1 hypothetical protein PF006_g13145 [Phytophthora fragariae]KAE9187238.1 hypothetical protein PF002_g25650 [Phytophthora fragariae]KAE9206086.1 hypothetical protein PF005_g13146 [Phytophthora fragariae]KAE9304758.1 hypothetical protein PF001_g12909 [Phytophthora fragariae]
MENEEARRMTVSSLGNGGNGACWKLTKPGCFRFRPVPLTRILVSGYTRPLAAYGTIGERSEDIMPTRMNTTTALSTGTTAAQRERLSLYGLPRRPNVFIQQEAAQAPPPPALVGTSPIIGGDYEFVEAQDWPHDIMHVTSNIFTVTQPYPVMQRYSTYRNDCGCDGDHCVVRPGERRTSSCINHYKLDLISTPVCLGVVCDSTIPKDAFVVEYVGEVLLGVDTQKRVDRRFQVELKMKAIWVGPTDVFIDAGRNATSNATYDSTFSTTSTTSRHFITNCLTGCRLLRPAPSCILWPGGAAEIQPQRLLVAGLETDRNVSSNTERDAISNTPAPELLLAAGRKARTNAAPDATDHDQSPAGCLAEHNKALGRPTPLSPRAG